MDNVDRNLTYKLVRSGEVDTARPTDDKKPFIIRYQVSDRAGNKMTAMRLVTLVCPPKEKRCDDIGSGLSCSVDGVCAGEVQAPVVTSLRGKPNQQPTITLVGAATVEVAQGETYAACLPTSLLTDVCDSGATAYDPEDGALACPPCSPLPPLVAAHRLHHHRCPPLSCSLLVAHHPASSPPPPSFSRQAT